jgi:hypothetical protein
MKKCIFTVSLSLVFLFFSLSAHAQNPSLTDRQVTKFISSMKEIHVLFQQYDDLDEFDELDDEVDDEATLGMAEEMEMLKGHEIYGRVQGIVRLHGFANIDEWGHVGDRVMKAFYSIIIEESAPAAQAQMEQTFREIEENPYYSSAQKEEIKERFKESTEALIADFASAPAEDVKVVRRHKDDLQQLFEVFEDDYDDDYDDDND